MHSETKCEGYKIRAISIILTTAYVARRATMQTNDNEEQPLSVGIQQPKNVGLFVTCLADLFRPSVAFDTIKLLEQAGCQVEVPDTQTCCGQPAYNSGHLQETIPAAKLVIETFSAYDYVVAPSGSCIGMIRHHYPLSLIHI